MDQRICGDLLGAGGKETSENHQLFSKRLQVKISSQLYKGDLLIGFAFRKVFLCWIASFQALITAGKDSPHSTIVMFEGRGTGQTKVQF